MIHDFETLLNGVEIARILKISASFAYTLMRRGEIPTVRIGRSVRVRANDLQAFVASRVEGDTLEEFKL